MLFSINPFKRFIAVSNCLSFILFLSPLIFDLFIGYPIYISYHFVSNMPTKSFDIRLPIREDLFDPLRGYPLVRYIYHIIMSANCKQNLIYISIQLLGKNQAMIRGFWGG